MKDKPEGHQSGIADLVSKSFGIIMVVLFLTLGTTIIFRASQLDEMRKPYAVVFGVVLILYGLSRAYRLYRKYF